MAKKAIRQNRFRSVLDILKRQTVKVSASGFHPKYMWDASSEGIRYWMLNSIYPKNSRGYNLHKAIDLALRDKEFIMQIGCGTKGQALMDLRKLGASNLIGIDYRVPSKEYAQIEFLSMDLTEKFPIDDDVFSGLIFGSYHFHYMKPEEQLHLLNEIDRITTKGSRGFLGPFFPRHLVDTKFSQVFPEYKNPLYGYVKSKSSNTERWRLYRSRVASLSTFSGLNTSAKGRKGIRFPILSFYDMSLRSFTGRTLGNARVKKDYNPFIPNEYFITFEK